MTPNPGDILAGKFRVERVIGVGGMGIVVAAIHTDLLERRAIKLMRPESAHNPHAVERFVREARAAARLRSEHVAKVHDVGRLESGQPFMVMEYLEGSDLNAIIKSRRSLPIEEAVSYVLQACEALAEAHGAGIVHRDLKPANLFLAQDTDGSPRVKVLDFGISKAAGSSVEGGLNITQSDALLGSPLFMSPEQMRSPRDADARSDQYSIGAILYKLVTGRAPFMADSILALFLVVMDKPADPPSMHDPTIPAALDAVILRCLAKDRADRYASVADLATALLPFAPASARPLVERITRVLSAGPSSSSSIPPLFPSSDSFRSSSAPVEGRATFPTAAPSSRDPSFVEWRDDPTKNQPKPANIREETSPGLWDDSLSNPSAQPSKRRRRRLSLAIVSAAAGAIVTAIVLGLVMSPSTAARPPEVAEPSLVTAAAMATAIASGAATVAPIVSAAPTAQIAAPPAPSGAGVAPVLVSTVPGASSSAPSLLPQHPPPSGSLVPPRGATSAPPWKKPDPRSRTTF